MLSSQAVGELYLSRLLPAERVQLLRFCLTVAIESRLENGGVCAGPAEQSVEEEWQKLQEHPDILAAAPDDEVLADMLALQVSLLTTVRMFSTLMTFSTPVPVCNLWRHSTPYDLVPVAVTPACAMTF